jgi:hypothetical protein
MYDWRLLMRSFTLKSGKVVRVADTFSEKLSMIDCLDELYGFANRRKVLGVDLPKWTEDERRMILARKYELERMKR